MKKFFLFQLILSLFLVSCSSDTPTIGGGVDISTREVPVSIRLSSDDSFSVLKSSTPQSAGLKSLLYIVYNQTDGAYVKHKYLANKDLSVINDSLNLGKYKIVVLGVKHFLLEGDNSSFGNIETDVPLHNFIRKGVNDVFEGSEYTIYSGSDDRDYFYKAIDIDVSASNNTNSITLERITAKLEILPSDVASIPANIDSISFYFKDLESQIFCFTKKSYSFDDYICHIYADKPADHFFGKKYSRQDFLKINASNPVSITLFPLSSPYAIIGFDDREVPVIVEFKSGQKTTTKTIKVKYTLERNKILRLTGNLFTSQPTVEESIVINDDWDAKIIEEKLELE